LYASITNFDWNTTLVYSSPANYQEPLLEPIESLETPIGTLPTLNYIQMESGQQLGFVMGAPARTLGVSPSNTYVYYAYSSSNSTLNGYAGVIGCNQEDFTVKSTFSFYPTTNETTLQLANFNYFDSFNVYSLNITQFVYSCGFAFYQAENCQNATYMRPCLVDWSPTLPIISDVVGGIGTNYTFNIQTSKLNAGYPSLVNAFGSVLFYDTSGSIGSAIYPETDTLFVDIVNGTMEFGIEAPSNTNFTIVRLSFTEIPYSTLDADVDYVIYDAWFCSSPDSLQTYTSTALFSKRELLQMFLALTVMNLDATVIAAGLQRDCAFASYYVMNCPTLTIADCVPLYQATL
jgi:hypothetical protein